MDKNWKIGPRAEEKFEKRGLERTRSSKNGTYNCRKCRTPAPSQKADSHVSGNRIRPKKKWTICNWRLFCVTVFVRRTPVEYNTTKECIGTVAPTMVAKFYNHTNTMRTCTDTMRTANDTPRIPVHAAQKTVDHRLRYFCIILNTTCFEVKIITRDIMFLWK